MKNKNLIIIISSIIIGAVFLIIGCFGGIIIENQIVLPKIEKLEGTTKAMGSQVISSIVAFGEVTKISGRNITLTRGNETLEVSVRQDAQVYYLDNQGILPTGPSRTETNFEAIKVGDSLNINIKVSADGQLEGSSVIILPPIESK